MASAITSHILSADDAVSYPRETRIEVRGRDLIESAITDISSLAQAVALFTFKSIPARRVVIHLLRLGNVRLSAAGTSRRSLREPPNPMAAYKVPDAN